MSDTPSGNGAASPRCFFRVRGGCDGRLDRAHLIPKQHIKRAFPHGLMRRVDGLLAPCARGESYVSGGMAWEPVSMDLVVWDPRCWTWMCRRHHTDFDAHRFRITREELPAGVISFATEHFLLARIDHDYGAPNGRPAHA